MDRINFLKDLNRKYFNGELSTNFLTRLQQLPVDRPDVFSFVERMFNFVRLSGIPAKDLSLFHADVMGTLLARILPGGWGGKIPPITVQGRHAIIDTYIGNNPYLKSNGKTMLDIGCGFPPFTTIEVSNYLKNWKVVGADPSLPAYLVYDEDGNYATFDDTKSIVYFQPAIPSIDNWNSLLSDASATKKRFEQLLNEFLINPKTEGFPRLEIDPIKSYETEFLSFKNGGIGEIEIEEKDVIRCFNVMYYFDNNFQDKALNWFSQKTVEGGIVMVGGDWAHSTECYYHLFQKESGELRKKEFAFSIDCISPFAIVTWYTNFGDDWQKLDLVKYIKIIRSNEEFMDEFNAFHDSQRARNKLCPRDSQGYYGDIDHTLSPIELWSKIRAMHDELIEAGFVQKVVKVLQLSGIKARVNEVNHIAIEL